MEKIEIITPLQDYSFMEGWYELSNKDHFWFEWRLRAFHEQLKAIGVSAETPIKVLDIGGGTGVLRKQVEGSTKWTVDLTDLDYNALKYAEPGRGRIMYYDINERKNEMHQLYDAILLFDVIEHIENTKPFVESLIHHLKPGGFLFVNVPALQPLFSKYDSVQGHFRRYNKKTLAAEFDSTVLKNRDSRFWGLANVPVAFLRKILLDNFQKNKSDEEIFMQGFKPPSSLINSAFLGLMNIETTLMSSPPSGTSILMTLQKEL